MIETDQASPATVPREGHDTDKSYAALVRFALMGPERSLRALAQQPDGNSIAQLFRWSAQHGWMARVRAYDAAVAAQAQAAFADEAAAIARAHAQEAAKLREMALFALSVCDREQLPAAVALRIWTEAVRVERLSLGLPTEATRLDASVTAQATVRAEVETIKRLMTEPDVHAAIAAARRAMSRQLQGQLGEGEGDGDGAS